MRIRLTTGERTSVWFENLTRQSSLAVHVLVELFFEVSHEQQPIESLSIGQAEKRLRGRSNCSRSLDLVAPLPSLRNVPRTRASQCAPTCHLSHPPESYQGQDPCMSWKHRPGRQHKGLHDMAGTRNSNTSASARVRNCATTLKKHLSRSMRHHQAHA